MNIRICFLTLFLAIFCNILRAQTTYIVNSNADAGDNDLTNSACDDGTGNCTLRAALEQVNYNNSGGDIIEFGFSSATTITPSTALPSITSPHVTIDGTEGGTLCGSLPEGSPHSLKVTVDGSSISSFNPIFSIEASDVTIMGLIIINAAKEDGIEIPRLVSNGQQAHDNATIECNYLGTDGSTDYGNKRNGINVGNLASNVLIHNNLISGNDVGGIDLGVNVEATVAGNLIGTDETGMSPISNGYGIEGAMRNSTFGGVSTASRNIISGNSSEGFKNVGSIVAGMVFQNNYVGVNINGYDPSGNMGNGAEGLDWNKIEGTITGNVISGNGASGLIIDSSTILKGNKIGVGEDGSTNIGNTGAGIELSTNGDNNVIGGSTSTDQNIIANNGGAGIQMDKVGITDNIIEGNSIFSNGDDGIQIIDISSINNTISANSIYSNAGLGIDLGATGNDSGDSDPGPNNLQNFPEIYAFTHEPGDQLSATINVPSSTSNSSYPLRLEFFESDGNGEGKIYLGYATYESTDAESTVKKFLTLPTPVYIPDPAVPIIATATDSDGNTSEFSSPGVLLPVELLSFNYSFDIEDRLWLAWSTASELNNEGFSILQSSDGQHWNEIGWVQGNGTSRELHHYRFQVSDQYVDDSYFRLKQVDFEGASTLHKAIFVEGKSIKDLSVFPTIINEEFSIVFTLKSSGAVSIKLRDIEGKVAQWLVNDFFQAGTQELSFNLSEKLSEGSYLVEIKADSFQATRKVLLRR